MHEDFTYNNFSDRNYLTEVDTHQFSPISERKKILVHLLSAELTFFLVFHPSMHQNTIHVTYNIGR